MSCHADRKLPKDLTKFKFPSKEKGLPRTEVFDFIKRQQLAREAEVRQLKRIRHDSGLGGTSD